MREKQNNRKKPSRRLRARYAIKGSSDPDSWKTHNKRTANVLAVDFVKCGKKYYAAVGRVSVNNRGAPSHFYSPAYAIGKQIQDALNPAIVLRDKVDCKDVLLSSGIRISVARKLPNIIGRDSELLYGYVYPNGRRDYYLATNVLEEGVGYIIIQKRKRFLKYKLPSKFCNGSKVLCKEAIKYRLLQKRGSK